MKVTSPKWLPLTVIKEDTEEGPEQIKCPILHWKAKAQTRLEAMTAEGSRMTFILIRLWNTSMPPETTKHRTQVCVPH